MTLERVRCQQRSKLGEKTLKQVAWSACVREQIDRQPAYSIYLVSFLSFSLSPSKCKGIALRWHVLEIIAVPWHRVPFRNTASPPIYPSLLHTTIIISTGLPASLSPPPISHPSSPPRSRPQYQASTTTTTWHRASSQTHHPVYPHQHGLQHPQHLLQLPSRIVRALFTCPLVLRVPSIHPSSSNEGLLSLSPSSRNLSRQYPFLLRRSQLLPIVVMIRPDLALSSTLVPTFQKRKVPPARLTPSLRRTRDVAMPSRNSSPPNWAT